MSWYYHIKEPLVIPAESILIYISKNDINKEKWCLFNCCLLDTIMKKNQSRFHHDSQNSWQIPPVRVWLQGQVSIITVCQTPSQVVFSPQEVLVHIYFWSLNEKGKQSGEHFWPHKWLEDEKVNNAKFKLSFFPPLLCTIYILPPHYHYLPPWQVNTPWGTWYTVCLEAATTTAAAMVEEEGEATQTAWWESLCQMTRSQLSAAHCMRSLPRTWRTPRPWGTLVALRSSLALPAAKETSKWSGRTG